MCWLKTIVIGIAVCTVKAGRDFPSGFRFGTATAAYQIEGAWNVSDKIPSIWDHFVHTLPERIADGSTGDVACNSYHLWPRDVEMASELGVHFYRFSISWSRLLPSGFSNDISEDAKKFYNNLIDSLLAKGIQPMVTIYHWDMPQFLQDLGGWTNPLVSDWFAEYARVVFSLFGDRVKTWLTLNEPIAICELTYNIGILAPGIINPGYGNYLCNKNTLLAHAKAWRIYDKEFRHKYKGKVSLTNQIMWFEPDTPDDVEITNEARQLMAGMYSHAIYSKRGGWPPVIERIVAENSKKEGRSQSRLPAFTTDEIRLIRGTYDFYGLNFYTSRTITKAKEGEEIGPWFGLGAPELGARFSIRPEWRSASYWLYINPEGIRKQLAWLKKEYGDIEILITENGFGNTNATLDDPDRRLYIQEHLEQILLSIKEDKVKVVGYTAWTLMDNFEWSDGYGTKFGLYHVDFKDPALTRTPRASAKYYAAVIKNNSLDINN